MCYNLRFTCGEKTKTFSTLHETRRVESSAYQTKALPAEYEIERQTKESDQEVDICVSISFA